jgi:glucose/mannose-6-phosphate isomerase
MVMEFDLPQDYCEVSKVVILGMGGSAIGGDLASSMLASEAKLPVLTYRGYNPPAFIDAQTLVIASSYSGMTEETLSSFEQTLGTEAKKLVITTGGRLKTIAEARNIPIFSFDYKAPSRATLGFHLMPILGILQKLGFVSDKSAEVVEADRVLQKLSQGVNEGVALADNPAKQLAQRLYGHLPVIYGAGIVSEVAHRWKTQLNENSKAWAFYEILPELNHNAILGYQFPPELAGKVIVVLLHSALLPHRIRLRYQITCQFLDWAKVGYQIVDGEGASPLSQMMSLVLYGDYTTYYLAILNRIDPSPVTYIAYLKEQLAKDKGDK